MKASEVRKKELELLQPELQEIYKKIAAEVQKSKSTEDSYLVLNGYLNDVLIDELRRSGYKVRISYVESRSLFGSGERCTFIEW